MLPQATHTGQPGHPRVPRPPAGQPGHPRVPRPPARTQATRKGWPYYIRSLARPTTWNVYSRATPCGWPGGGLATNDQRPATGAWGRAGDQRPTTSDRRLGAGWRPTTNDQRPAPGGGLATNDQRPAPGGARATNA